MARPIRVQLYLEVDDREHGFQLPRVGDAIQDFEQTGKGGGTPGQITATAAGVNIDFSALTVLGWLRLENTSLTETVQWGTHDGTFRIAGRMKPGEPAMTRMEPGATYHVKSLGADAIVKASGIED